MQRYRATFAIAIFSFFGNSMAYDSPAPYSSTIPTVEVNSTSYNPRSEDTASRTVVNHAEIIRYGDSSLIEVMKRLPGISIGSNGIQLRGLGDGYVQLLLNGEPAPAGFSVTDLPPNSVERIEIIRSASAEFSTQAISGTINVILRKIQREVQRELRTGVGTGAGATSSSINLQLSGHGSIVSYALSGDLSHTGSTQHEQNDVDNRAVATGQTDESRQSRRLKLGSVNTLQLAPRLSWAFTPGNTLVWQNFLRYADNDFREGEDTVTLLGTAPLYPQRDSHNVNQAATLSSKLNWLLSLESGTKLDMKLGVNLNRRGNRGLFSGNDNETLVLRRSSLSRILEHGVSLSAKYTRPASGRHLMMAGIDGSSSKRGDIRKMDDTVASVTTALHLDDSNNARIDRLAFFAQNEWNATPAVSLYAGIRWEGIKTSTNGTINESNRYRSSVWSPILQGLWRLSPASDTQLRAGLARTYKPPPATSLVKRSVTSTENSTTRPAYQGNPALRPELAWSLDMSLEHHASTGTLYGASTYLRKISDRIGQSLSQHDGLWTVMPDNHARAYAYGMELEAKLPLKSLSATAPNVDMRINLARNWSRVTDVPAPYNRLADQTPFNANVGIDWNPSASAVMMGANFSFQSGAIVRETVDSLRRSSPSRTLDAYVRWKFSTERQLRLSLANMLGGIALSQAQVTSYGSTMSDTTTTPLYRSVRLQYEHKFR